METEERPRDAMGNTEAWPPCRAACPAHTDCRGYAALVALGRPEEALSLIRERAPLAASLGRICHHPCEDKCRRGSVDEPVAIRSLKRYAADVADDEALKHHAAARTAPTGSATGKRIAVIGGGPAGLTAAADLAKAGHAVTVFEKRTAAGGALLAGVPPYRLPKDVLARDVDHVRSLGVEIIPEAQVDAKRANELESDFDAIIVATGLPLSRSIDMPGVNSSGVLLALPFLEAANEGSAGRLSGKVVVVGGGNVAMDVARSALRLGANEVSLYCLEGPELTDLPAFLWEIEEALEEGVKINPSWGPVEIKAEGDTVKGLVLQRCLRVFDEKGAFSPAFDSSNRVEAAANAVILAIGQAGDTGFLSEIIEHDARGRIVFNRRTAGTSNPKVFAAGEIVTGPGSAIEAIASGHAAAEAVDAYFRGEELKPSEEAAVVGELPEALKAEIAARPRAEGLKSPVVERIRDFREVEATLSEEAAVREAMRCLSCGAGAVADPEICAGCLTCARVCPFDAPEVAGTALMKVDYCQACGLCAAECPAEAISIGAGEAIGQALTGEEVTVFACREALLLPHRYSKVGRQVIGVSCAARTDELAILKAFEAGSERVLILCCPDGECRYGATNRLEERTKGLKALLDEIGIGSDKLEVTRENICEESVTGGEKA